MFPFPSNLLTEIEIHSHSRSFLSFFPHFAAESEKCTKNASSLSRHLTKDVAKKNKSFCTPPENERKPKFINYASSIHIFFLLRLPPAPLMAFSCKERTQKWHEIPAFESTAATTTIIITTHCVHWIRKRRRSLTRTHLLRASSFGRIRENV